MKNKLLTFLLITTILICSNNKTHTLNALNIPNDTSYNQQWAIDFINLPSVWDFTTGSDEIKVGVLDSGIDYSHYDLGDNTNNVYYDCINLTNNMPTIGTGSYTSTDHGTQVAGIIGAKGNNDFGTSGVCWDINMTSFKIGKIDGSFDPTGAKLALIVAEQNNIDICNLSGGWIYSKISNIGLDTSINNYDGLLICASGNNGVNIDTLNNSFPSCFNLNNTISVGAIDESNKRADTGIFSTNYGQNTVDIYAPGLDIYTTTRNNSNYDYFQLTSAATPFVTGVAALLKSINTDLTTSELKNSILNGADMITLSVPSGGTQTVKKLDAFGALKYVFSNYALNTQTIFSGNNSFSNTIDGTSTIFVEKNAMNKINIQSNDDYDFSISSDNPIDVKLYTSNLSEITIEKEFSSDNSSVSFTKYLSEGSYYIRANYVNNNSGTINFNIEGADHVHSYDANYSWYNSINHIANCECGTYQFMPHAVVQGTTICIQCGGQADMGINPYSINSTNINYVTDNGSYILPNGVIILVEEDIEDYLKGTLLFYKKDSEYEIM